MFKKINNKNRLGEKLVNNQGLSFEIIEYNSAIDCSIKFEDGTIIKSREYRDLKKGSVRNPFYPIMYGIGYMGIGKYKSNLLNNRKPKVFDTWHDMLKRCYSEESFKKCPTYQICTVSEEWHNFQNFGKWFDENYVEGYCLDKDILVKGNKIYSSKTCCFVPKEINNLLINCNKKRKNCCIGVNKYKNTFRAQLNINNKQSGLGVFHTMEEAFAAYKINKEKRIKEKAEEWKDKITNNVYNALLNYIINITD